MNATRVAINEMEIFPQYSAQRVPGEPSAEDARWERVLAKDKTADGEFVYAVSSTGIYCRPSCPSKRPSRKNVKFFESPAAAERAGFRACRRCEPQMFAAVLEKRRLDAELSLAQAIQTRLFPSAVPALVGWELAARTRPCREVGGDYFDYFTRENDGMLVFALGDVSGKGIGAALLVTSLHAAVRASAASAKSPAETMTELNRYLFASTPSEQYATLFCAQLDLRTGRLEYANAGHVPPLLLHREGTTERVNSAGLPVGLFADAEYKCGSLQLQPGDLLAVASDGITECVGSADTQFGDISLIRSLRAHAPRGASAALAAAFQECERWAARSQPADDASLLVLQRRSE
jgi:serine phosphatase RsbU (regulator of sigma subunit)